MCDVFIRIVSNRLGSLEDGSFLGRDILDFIGCNNLASFLRHLKRNDCTDYDKDNIQNVIDTCEHGQPERLNETASQEDAKV